MPPEKNRRRMDATLFAEQFEGKFVSIRGKVFEILPTFVITGIPQEYENRPVFVSVRRGYRNPYVVQWIYYIKETKQYIVFQEYYKTEVNTPEVVETIKEVNTGRRVVLHATRDDESVIDLRTHGIGATKNEQSEKNKDKAMMDRIRCMIDVVQQGRILFSVGCPKTLEDFKELSWSDKQAEKDKEEIEKPLTKHLPGVDCLSYVVYFIEKSYGRVK